MQFKMLKGHCVPVTTPDDYFEIAVKLERHFAKQLKELVVNQRLKTGVWQNIKCRIEREVTA